MFFPLFPIIFSCIISELSEHIVIAHYTLPILTFICSTSAGIFNPDNQPHGVVSLIVLDVCSSLSSIFIRSTVNNIPLILAVLIAVYVPILLKNLSYWT